MAMLETEQQLLDTYGIPEYFTTHAGLIEDAGDGIIRVVQCVIRHGSMQPIYSALVPASRFLITNPNIRQLAEKILRGDGAAH